jgi:CRISPR-associated endonuclease Cas1 subtype II
MILKLHKHTYKACKIKVKDENLLLTFLESEKEENIKVTINDIDFILFDNVQFSITGKAIELLSKNGTATLFIDEEFHPSSILVPYHTHTLLTEMANIQISITQEFKAQAWQNIIKSKISNQSATLKYWNKKEFTELEVLSQNVQLFDSNNDEAQSARIYWKSLFANKIFRREQGSEDIINSMLNYTYAILRATMARSLSTSGFLPVFGIWHQNRYNAFNLVDDLIEPFRAFGDLYVKLLLNSKYSQSLYLTIPIKRDLVKLLTFECVKINKGISNLSKGIEVFVKQYKRAVMADDTSLIVYPSINEEFFRNECF